MPNPFHGLGRLYREGTLFNNNFVGLGIFSNLPGGFVPVLQIGRHSGAGPKGFGGSIDTHENDIRFANPFLDFSAEKEVSSPGSSNHPIKTRFIDRQFV
jgi:hypothetical protein